MSTTAGIFQEVATRLRRDPARARGRDGRWQFQVSGKDPGTYALVIAQGKATVLRGTIERPDTTIRLDSTTLVRIVEGRADAGLLFLLGQITVGGNAQLAGQLGAILR